VHPAGLAHGQAGQRLLAADCQVVTAGRRRDARFPSRGVSVAGPASAVDAVRRVAGSSDCDQAKAHVAKVMCRYQAVCFLNW